MYFSNEEVFEDRMGSCFGNDLNRIVKTQGIAAVVALEKVMNCANVKVAEEALIRMGRIDDQTIYFAWRTLL